MRQQIVTVVGGSGFLGRYVVRRLAQAGATVRVLCRFTERAAWLKTQGYVGQIVVQYANLARSETLEQKFEGSSAVVNLAGLLYERGSQKFSAIHERGAEEVARLAKASGASKFIHISALGIDKSEARYATSKLGGEQAIRSIFPQATILRPSVIYGPEDNFFNRFAGMAMAFPALPLIGGGKTLLQPVYVEDVANAVTASLVREDAGGRTYELGGPKVYSLRELLEFVNHTIRRSRMLMPVPFPAAKLLGGVLGLLPVPPLTRDQVRLLESDSIVGKGVPTFSDLDIAPTSLELIVPDYLERYRPPVRN